MKISSIIASGCILILLVGVPARSQEPHRRSNERAPLTAEPVAATDGDIAAPAAAAEASVLRLLRFNGAVKNKRSEPRTSAVGITFALYADREGGTPLWLETQNVELDAQGRYSLLLGAATREGLPLEIFSSGEARWLGIQVQGEEEQARILLVSVPYALKAADADRLGGRPASDFALASSDPTFTGPGSQSAPPGGGGGSSLKGSGTANFISRWSASDILANSLIFQTPDNKIGIDTVVPAEKLHVAGNVMANIFFGSGSGLTQLNPANLTAGTAGINISGNAANADLLDNLDSTQFARLDVSNLFAADQTIPNLFVGNVNSTGILSAPSVVASTGSMDNLTINTELVALSLSGTSGRFTDTLGVGPVPFVFSPLVVTRAGYNYPPVSEGDSLVEVRSAGSGSLNAYLNVPMGLGGHGTWAFALNGAPAGGLRFFETPQRISFMAPDTAADVEAFTVTPAGNVGIGTTTPFSPLTISRPQNATAFSLIIDEGGGSINDPFFNGLAVTQGGGAVLGSFKVVYHGDGHTDLSLSTRLDPDAFYIKDGGNVGIGTPTPVSKLEVAGTVTATAFVGNASGLTAGSANDLSCASCVSTGELNFDPATQVELDAETAARQQGDADTLSSANLYTDSSVAAEATARMAADTALQVDINGKVSKSGDTMSGTLTLPANGLVAGTNQLVLSGGKVGIGTPSPDSTLSVVGTANFTDNVRMVNPGVNFFTSDAGLFIAHDGNQFGWASPALEISRNGNFNPADIIVNVYKGGPTPILTVTGLPGVGIHTLTPSNPLSVVGNADFSGNVGIGTPTPAAKLQVAGGDAYVSTAGSGIIVKSPDGTQCARIGIDNAGVLSVTALACP